MEKVDIFEHHLKSFRLTKVASSLFLRMEECRGKITFFLLKNNFSWRMMILPTSFIKIQQACVGEYRLYPSVKNNLLKIGFFFFEEMIHCYH